MGRPSELDRRGEDFRKQLAELYVAGKTREEISDVLGGDKKTITRWMKDPRVMAMVTQLTRERTNRVTRKIDSIIESRLENAEKMDTETLLKIRKELTPRQIEVGGPGSMGGSDMDIAAWEELDRNPDYDVDSTAEEEPLELPAGYEPRDES